MQTHPAAYSAGTPRHKLEFAYDSQGRRFSKKAYTWDTSTHSYTLESSYKYLYDGWNLIAQLETLNTPTPTVHSTYTWGQDLSGSPQGAGGVGGLLSVVDKTGSTYLPTYDSNGNVMGYFQTDTETLVAEYEYGPFGEITRSTGSKKDDFNFRFSTKYEDAETGFLYYGFRYYDPEVGRWLNRDPIEELGGLNLYAMVENDPVNKWDLLGLKTKTENFLFVSYFSESCVPVVSVSLTAPSKLWKYVSQLVSTASFLQGLIGTLERTDTQQISVPDCYILEKDPATGSVREEVSYDVIDWRISLDTAFSVEVCGRVKETVEWFWIPDSNDECCK